MKNNKMQAALNEARLAAKAGEVPVGAAIFLSDKLISSAHNETISRSMPDAHAEILAIRKACEVLGDWRLSDCELYVTLEPCAMCTGTIMLAKIKRLYFGAYDAQSGVCGGKIDITRENLFGSNLEVYGGICEKECSELLSDFFSNVRNK
ncbi:MAG: nucleoside deaminase [Clostridia bacterium]|nr:nucleoside deaminase [Clostridia bacterium]